METRVINGKKYTVTVVESVYKPTKPVIGYKRSQGAWTGLTDLSRHHYPRSL